MQPRCPVWRECTQEIDRMAESKAKEAKGEEKGKGERDAEFQCLKQRATGDEPLLRLWFDPECLQFKQSEHWKPRPYLHFSALAESAA